MTLYGKDSGIAITSVRVQHFRSLANVEVELGDLTVLIGANNSGKTSFLEALFAAVGAGRKTLGPDDVHLAAEEATAPKSRAVLVDLMLRPVGDDGKVSDKYPEGSFWTGLWSTRGIAYDGDSNEFTAIRTALKWSDFKGEYVLERKFLKEWKPFADWTTATVQDRALSAAQLEALALHFVDAKRDLEDDLRRPGSFWRRLTEELGLPDSDVASMEETLSRINEDIVAKSPVLKHLKENLVGLQRLVFAGSGAVDIAPVARKLRDLSRGVDVSFSTGGTQSFPLSRHGMGTRSLASLMVFRAYVSWKNKQTTQGGDKVHSVLALEEPESHLHPQAQRSLFARIKEIPGQRIVSTHSPYFAGQARLEDLRLFIKRAGDTIVAKLDLSSLTDPNDVRKLQETVIDTRGDLLFAHSLVFFEGQTEEQALPIWAQKYWGASIHELGFCFVRVNGTDYFPFVWLANALQIPWYIFADGEDIPVKRLDAALARICKPNSTECANVVVHPVGKNFESQLIDEGYMKEIEKALDAINGTKSYLDAFIDELHGAKGKKGVIRDYKSAGGRERAAFDAMSAEKTSMSKHLGQVIASLPDPTRRFPAKIRELFDKISAHSGFMKDDGQP